MQQLLSLKQRIEAQDWKEVNASLLNTGFSHRQTVLTVEECEELKALYDKNLFRSVINMERYRFGKGEYKYFHYPLADLIQELRTSIYPYLVDTANGFVRLTGQEQVYPPLLSDFIEACHRREQTRPTPLILKYGRGGYNTLHQDLYGDIYFPFQAVVFLSEPGQEYSGGEFVMVEQRPRAQSKAEVLLPRQGDMLIFTTNFRPVKGTRGYYKVTMKHGVSKVRSGERLTLGIIFHDAK